MSKIFSVLFFRPCLKVRYGLDRLYISAEAMRIIGQIIGPDEMVGVTYATSPIISLREMPSCGIDVFIDFQWAHLLD